MDTREKMGLVEDDGGVKMVEMGSKGLGNELVLVQDSVSQANGFEITECAKGGFGSSWGSAEWDFQGQVVGETEV